MRGPVRKWPRVPWVVAARLSKGAPLVMAARLAEAAERVIETRWATATWRVTVAWLATVEVRSAGVLRVMAVVRLVRMLLRLPEALLQLARCPGPAPTARRTATHTMTARGASRL